MLACVAGSGAISGAPAPLQHALVLGEGDHIEATAAAPAPAVAPAGAGAGAAEADDAGLKFLLIAGQPIKEPVVQHGPFVMNSKVSRGERSAAGSKEQGVSVCACAGVWGGGRAGCYALWSLQPAMGWLVGVEVRWRPFHTSLPTMLAYNFIPPDHSVHPLLRDLSRPPSLRPSPSPPHPPGGDHAGVHGL